jgi:hypothetical protein
MTRWCTYVSAGTTVDDTVSARIIEISDEKKILFSKINISA